MPGIKNLTVRHLRDLARKHLGKGHSKLKTKEELIAALRKIVPGLLREEGGEKPAAAAAAAKKKKPVAKKLLEKVPIIHFAKPAKKPSNGSHAKPAPKVEPEPPRAPPEVVQAANELGPTRASARHGGKELQEPVLAAEPPRAPPPPPPPAPPAPPAAPPPGGNDDHATAAEPLVEGFFVARVAGEGEARRHHLTFDQAGLPREAGGELHYDERLVELPWEYQDDRVVALARDPFTLFLYWDFRPETRDAAFRGMDAARAVLRIYEGGRVAREVDLALESRSWYVGGLTADRTYRAELFAVSRDGSWRRIGPSSNEVRLPADAPSQDTTVRFMRVPWGVPLPKLKEGMHTGRVKVETPEEPPAPLVLTHERWVPLPSSGSWQLVQWQEVIPRERSAPAPGAQMPHLELGEVPMGGGSSWTLQGSWQLGGLPSSRSWPPKGEG